MRIVFTTWGSLGDLHPYMALALELRRRGHDASIATLGFYRDIVESAGLGFHPLRPDVSPDDPGARELVRRVLDAKDGPRHLMLDVFAPVIDQVEQLSRWSSTAGLQRTPGHSRNATPLRRGRR